MDTEFDSFDALRHLQVYYQDRFKHKTITLSTVLRAYFEWARREIVRIWLIGIWTDDPYFPTTKWCNQIKFYCSINGV